ncbi:hypothetical protein VNO80_15940 [Phaseolus coccineus]|uniref:Uncharacterized protein n=1 Tax=Phaseolus coccineus TaxID=3886 RepID=A0AAN9ML80_PHACN
MVVTMALESTSKTWTKLSREEEATREPTGWQRRRRRQGRWSSECQSLTVSSRKPVRRGGGQLAVGCREYPCDQPQSSCTFSTDLIPTLMLCSFLLSAMLFSITLMLCFALFSLHLRHGL